MIFAQSLVFFITFYLISLVLTVSCSDWFLIWVGLELNMMSFIALVYERSSGGAEVCMKYFFIQSLGSGILMMMFYTDFYWIEFISMCVLSYKMGGGPFYFWFPSICENIGWGSCWLLMTIQKVLPMLLISFLTSMLLWFIVVTSMFLGAVGSMNQKKMKRLMAYSSVHHIGWMLLGNFVSENMWLVYLFMYMLMLLGIINSLSEDKILDVGGLGKITKKWSFVLGMLSMGGMPPMLGFYLKWWMFYNLLWMDMSMILLMIILSVLMFYVYFRVVYMVIMESGTMSSWMIIFSKKKMISLDLLYIMGVNMGVVVWLLL